MRVAAFFSFLAAAAAVSVVEGAAPAVEGGVEAQRQVSEEAHSRRDTRKPEEVEALEQAASSPEEEQVSDEEARRLPLRTEDATKPKGDTEDNKAFEAAERKRGESYKHSYPPQSVGYYLHRRALKRKKRQRLESRDKVLQRLTGSTAGSGEQ